MDIHCSTTELQKLLCTNKLRRSPPVTVVCIYTQDDFHMPKNTLQITSANPQIVMTTLFYLFDKLWGEGKNISIKPLRRLHSRDSNPLSLISAVGCFVVAKRRKPFLCVLLYYQKCKIYKFFHTGFCHL